MMNKSYRSIWNEALGAWVAVSEIEKAKGKPVSGAQAKVARQGYLVSALRTIPLMLGMAFGLSGVANAAPITCNAETNTGNATNNNLTCGVNTSANHHQSIAIGSNAKALGAQSVALGADTDAKGKSSIAIGGDDLTVMPQDLRDKYQRLTGNPLVESRNRYPRTTSEDGGVAVGVSTRAGKLATAFGPRAYAQGDVSLALGVGSHADKENAVAIGAGSTTAGDAAAPRNVVINGITFSFNGGTNLKAGDQVSFGTAGFERQLRNVAPGAVSENSTDGINGSQLYAVAHKLTEVDRNVTTLQGDQVRFYSVGTSGLVSPQNQGNYNNNGATASKAIAAGVGASATAAKSVVVGSDSTVSGEQSVSIGSENLVSGRDTYVLGSGNHKRGNAEGGKVGISANNSTVVGKGNIVAADADVHIQGNDNLVTRTHALVMGSHNTVSGSGASNEEPAIAIGSTNTVSNDNALAIGKSNNASAQSSIAVGVNSQATARSTVAIGNTAKATDENGLAIGSYAEAGNYATAVGSQARAKKAHGVAVGTTTYAGERATTVGRYSASHADSSIALGSDALVTTNAHASVALGSGSVVSGAYSGALSSSIQNNQTINGNRAIDRRSVVGGQESYAIGNKNIVGSRSNDTFILGNNVKIGATGATLTTTNITKAERTDAVAFQEEAAVIGAVALGSDTGVTVSDGVALGRGSKAATDKGVVGADPLNAVTDKNGAAWKSTKGAVAVGSTVDGYTRQITGLAAGKEDTDAVNVAQLKAAGFKVTTAASDGQVVGNTEEKIQNGELFTVDAGKNIKITQSGKKVSVATKDDVEFTSVTAGGNVLDGTAINVGGQTYTNVAAAINALASGGSAAQTHYFSVHSTDRSDESNFNNGGATGNDALAAGRRAKASAAEAVAVGSDVTASGNQSLAVGNLVSATHLGATAIGNNAKALNTGAQAFGQSSEARGENSAAIGRLAIATGDRASAFGVGNTASGISSFSGGDKARSEGEKSIALGFESSVAATGSNAIAVGTSAVSAATNSVVIGSRASVAETGSGSVAIGAVSKANGVNATAVGQASEASGQNSFAGGQDSHATGKSSVAVGDGAKARVDSATAVGAYAHAGPEGTDEELATLLTSDKNAGAGASAFGISSKATTYRSLALGASSNASGGNSALAVGDSANASAGDAVAIGKSSAASAAQAVALGRQATANIAGGVAIGYMSKTEIDKGVSGADPLNVQANKTGNKVWTSTRAAVSVGDVEGGTTRQITGLAAGAQDTDAVNVAQLKAAGFQLQATASDGQVAGSAAQKVKNGDLFALDAGKNIKLSQSEGKISIATKEDVAFNSVTVDGVVINNAGINAGNKVITGVAQPTADDHAANKAYVDGGRTKVTSSNQTVNVVTKQENGANVYDLSVDTSLLAKADGTNLNIQYGGDNGSNGRSALNQPVQFNGTANEIVTEAANGSVTFKLADSVKNQIEANKAKSQQALDKATENTAKIAENAASIQDHTTKLAQNQAKAEEASNKAVENAGRLDRHDTSIREHADKIAANQTAVEKAAAKAAENTDKIAENAASIQDHTAKIAQNQAKAEEASNKAADNAGKIDRNTASIQDHAAKIAANETKLQEAADKAGENTVKIAENAASIRQNADKIAQGLNFKGDKGAQFKRELGETVAVKGADANISTTADNGTISIELSKTLDLGVGGSITTGATKVANNGITLTSADGGNAVRLSSDGLDNGGKAITNIADGQNAGDAVTKRQLDQVASGGWNLRNNAQEKDLVKQSDAVDFVNGEGTTALVETTGDNASTVRFSVNKTGFNVNDGAVTAQAAGDVFATATDVAKAINDGEKTSSVVAGNNTRVEAAVQGNNTAYTVHAEKATVSGSDAVKVTAGQKNSSDVTDYAVDLTDAAKEDIKKGVAAKEALDGKGLAFSDGNGGTSSVKKLGESVTVSGDGNISTTANSDGIQIRLNPELTATSLTTGDSKLSSDGLTIEGGPSVTKAGIDAAGKKITKVAAGQADDDAVNVGQLKDSDNIAKANMEALGGSYDAATDTYTRPNYVVKNTEGVAKPAVHTVQEALSSLNQEIEKPLTFAADKGADSTRKLGSTIGIKAGNFAGAASADNLVTENNGNGEITIKLADNPTFKGKVSAKGLDAGGLQITGVAQGENGTDAVNVDQLRQAMKDITVENLALVAADSPFSYVNNAGDQLVRKVNDQGKAYFVKASDGKTRYEGDDIVVSALNAQDPQTSVATRVTNVGKGTKDTDAVNTAQLKEVLTALGTTLGEDGALVKPVYTVTRADGTPAATVNTVGEALGHLNTVLKDPITVSGNTNNGTSTIVTGGSDQKLGSKLQIKGALVDGASSSAANIRTVVTDGAVEIQLADAPTFAGKVSAQGFDAGNARITGVAEGTHAADAVNKAQLDAVADKVNAGWDLTANGSGRSKVAPGASVDLKNTDNNIVVSKADDSNDVTFNLAENLNIGSVTAGDSVLSSDGLAINNGPSITKAGINASGKAVSNIAAGKDAADAVNVSQLTPLAQALGVTVDTGSGMVTAPAFTVTKADGSRYEAADTIQGALNNIGSEIQKPITFAGDNAAGNFGRKLGTTVNLKGGADEAKLSERNIGVVSNGSDTLDIKLSKELTGLTSAEFTDAQGNRSTVNGGSISFNHADGQKAATLDSDGLRINNGPSLTQNGLDAADTVIRNVAAGNVGENSKDAVNAGQLYAQGKGVEKLLGGSTRYNPADGSYTNNDIGGTGKNNLHEAIAAVHATAGAGWNLTAEGANSSNVAAGETVDLRSTDKNIVITKTAESDQVSFDLADAVTADSFTAGDTVVGTNGVAVGDKAALTAEGLTLGNAKNGKAPVVLNSDGLNNGGNAITNIAAGKNSNDAVNVSQLTPLASALGMAFDAANGGWSAPSFTVSRADGSTYPAVNTVQGALDHIGAEIRKPIRFAGNTGVAERKLDETLVVKGSLADNAQASDQNIRTKVEAGTLTIELAESPKFGGVTVNDNGKITGIESGNVEEGSKEAVTGGQLHAHGKGVESIIGGATVYNPDTGTYTQADIGGTGAATVSDAIAAVRNTANTGWNLTAQGKNSSNVQPGETVDLRNNDGNIVVAKTDADDNVTFDLAKTLTVEAVKTGATKVDGSGVGVGDDVALTSDGLTVNNAANGKTVSLGSSGLNNGGNVITGLANGLMAEGSQEAVTGDQLFAVDKKVGENTAALNRGLDFAGNSGNFNRRLGERATIKGGLDNTVAASDTNVRTVADSTGNIQILLADAPVFKGKLKAQGLDAGGQKITGVKDGEEAGDAVNVSQLQRALDNQTITHQSLVQANSPFSYVNSRGEVLARQVDEKGKERFIKVADGTEYTEKDISISSLNPLDPQTAVPTVVGNIADGKKDNDAANIGQLKNAVKALGGGAAVNADGSIKDPVYTIARNNGGHETVNNVGDALNLLNAELNKPLTFVGDNQDVKVVRSLDTELAVKGGANGKLTENNIGVTGSTDDNSLVIKLAENVNLGENGRVTTGKTVVNNSGVAVGGNVALTSDGLKAGGVSVSHSGIHAGGKTITGVKAGQEATDAVNKAQLDAVQAAASSKVAAQGNLTVKENTNEDGSTTYTLTTADDVNFSSVTSGKGANQVVLDDKGVNVGGKTYLTAQGINANGNKVSNVGKGSINADSTDAVTGSQLHGTASSLAKLFGGDATVNADGSVQMNNIGGTGAATVEEAIKAVNQAVVVSKVAVVQGDNIVVDKATNADGSATYTVSAAKDLKLDSVSVGGNTTINGNGISIANGPSLNANGLDAAGKKLTNVADGEISATSKEAVNGSQLYQAYQVLGGNNTSINMQDAPGTTGSDGNTTPAGTVTTVVTNPDGTQTTTVETNQKVAVSTDKGGNQYTLVTYNVEGQNTYVTNDVIQAIGKMNEQGIKFFHTNDGEVKAVAQGSNNEDSSASGAYATAIGFQTAASGQGAVALGNTYTLVDKDGKEIQGSDGKAKQQRTQATGKNAVAIGTGSQANNENTIAIGTGNIVNGKNAGAIGDPSVINGNNTYAVGNNNTVNGSNTFVLGNSVTETIDNSVVLGNEAAAKGVHKAATGSHYTYAGANDGHVAGVQDVVGVVSVGKEGQTRQIQNVAAGVVSPTSTDAINGSQLYHTNEAINQVGNQVVNVGNYLNQRIDDIESKSNAGTAAAMAVAGLPQAYLPGKSMMAVSGSTYRGESGYAVGFSSISDNGNWVVKGTATGNSRGHYGATAGVGYQW